MKPPENSCDVAHQSPRYFFDTPTVKGKGAGTRNLDDYPWLAGWLAGWLTGSPTTHATVQYSLLRTYYLLPTLQYIE